MRRRAGGYLLVPLVLMLAVVSAVAFLMSFEGSVGARLEAGEAESYAAHFVAHAGLEHALWQVTSSHCGGDLTLATTPLGAHSYSATVTAGGSTNPHPLSVDQDAWIRSDDPDKNNDGADQHIRFENGKIEQALFRFDLSPLPAGARIVSASARFHVEGNGDHPEGPITVHRVTADWTETGVTWESLDGGFDTAPLATIPRQDTDGVWVSVNVTAAAQAWLNGGEPNHGLLLRSEAEGVHAKYTSRSGGAPPILDVVVATGAPAPASIQATGTLANGVSRTLARESPSFQAASGLEIGADHGSGRDTMVKQDEPTWNLGSNALLWVQDTSGGVGDRALLRFDLAGVPTNARTVSATLSLHQGWSGTPGGSVGVHRILREWDEGSSTTGPGWGATWNDAESGEPWTAPGGDFVAETSTQTAIPSGGVGRHEWDVTALVNAWTSGTAPNHGLLLASASSGTDVGFASSDDPDPSLHPRLTLQYRCECGDPCLAPRGGGDLLLVVGNQWSPAASDLRKQEVLERWGYDVDLIDDDTSSWFFDWAFFSNDVVLVSSTASDSQLAGKVASTSLGVVTELGDQNDELGLATGAGEVVEGRSLAAIDVAHYITAPFPTGTLPIYRHAMGGQIASGSLAPALRVLATWPSGPALAILDTGAPLAGGGGAAPGRRAMLPLGSESQGFDWSHLDARGLLLVQRTIEWARGAEGTPQPTLWLSTLNDVSGSGAPGLDAWSDGTALEFGDPGLVLEPGTTAGTFSAVFDLDDFAADGNADIDALHYVGSDVRVGSVNAIDLLAGDVLLSTASSEKLSSTNELGVGDEDVFVFRPDSAGDYGSGTFLFLLDGSQIPGGGEGLVGVSLVEKDTDVGDGFVPKGSFLVALADRRDVIEFTADDVGPGTTSGSANELVDGPDIDLGSEIRGLDLAEENVSIGGQLVPQGAILMTLNNDDGAVGDNRIAADSADVFYLTVTRTGPTSEADATLLFEGADVNLDASAEHIQALGLTTSTTPGSSGGPGFYRDELGVRTCDAADYLGSDGTLDWSAETWLELGESDGSCSGLAQLFTDGDYSLGLWGDGLGFERAVDLSMFGDAYLHFDYRRMEWEGGEAVVVEAFDEGAGVWVEIGRIDVADDDASYHAATYDLGPYTTSGARVRIRAEGLETKEDGFQLDDVQIDDDSTGLGEPPPGPPGAVAYVERNEPWAATSSDTWESVDLTGLGVPADAVVEVAITNSRQDAQRWGGVRAAGSSLDRRFQLHEAESGGVDAVVLHVQANASSQIEHYADNTGDVRFTALGYWTGTTYEERFVTFSAGRDASWERHDLSPHGVGPAQVAEIVVTNTSTSGERVAGARRAGSSVQRRIDVHEAESGGIDVVTIPATTDASSGIEVYAESDGDVDFTLAGYWSSPPGKYIETGGTHGQASQANRWEGADLGAFGAPPRSVAQLVLSNEGSSAERRMGLRETGSSEDRSLELQEAESGGSDAATMQVNVDDGSRVEWFSEATSDQYFYPIGWWVLP